MASWLTGYTTTAVFSGPLVGSTECTGPSTFDPDVGLNATSSYQQIICNGMSFTANGFSKYDGDANSNLQVSFSCPDGYTDNPPIFHNNVPGPGTSSLSMNGSWSIHIPVRERATTYTPADATIIDGQPFPTRGGAATADGLPDTGVQYTLETIPGQTCVCQVTCGPYSNTHSFTIAASSVIGFLMQATSETTCGGGVNNTTFVGTEYQGASIATTYQEVYNTGGIDVEVDALSGGANAVVTGQGGCGITLYINPPISWTLNGRLRSWGQVYPGSAVVNWINTSSTTVTLTPSAGSVSGSVTQQNWSATAYYNDGTNIAFPSGGINQWQAPSCYLASLSPDEPADWRIQFSGQAWSAFSLQRALTTEVNNCSALTSWAGGSNTTLSLSGGIQASVAGGVGSLSLNTHSVRVWEAYRYLQFTCLFSVQPYDNTRTYGVGAYSSSGGSVYQANTSTTGHAPPSSQWNLVASPSVTLTVGLASQTWQIVPTMTSSAIEVDLCCAYSETETVDSTETRFPITNPGGYPINYDPIAQYKMGWGVNWCDSLSISAIPDGITLTISDVSLATNADVSTKPSITLLPGFANYLAGWTSPTDITTQDPWFLLQSNGRPLDMPAQCLVTPTTGPTSPTYTYYAISDLQTLLTYFPGLTASALSGLSDGFHNSSLPLLFLGGQGATLDWTSHIWKDWVDINLPQTSIPSQDQWDEITGYPMAGNFFSLATRIPGPSPLQFSKSLRCQANGMTFNSVTQKPLAGATVKLFTTVGSTPEGLGTTGTLGYFQTGTPWGFGGVNSETWASAAPHPNATGVIQNRVRRRTSFRTPALVLKALGYDVANALRHAVVYQDTGSGDIILSCAGNEVPQSWTPIDTGFAGLWARCRFQDLGSSWPVGVFYGDGTNCYWAQTFDEGATFVNSTALGAGLVGDFDEGSNGLRWFFKVVGTGPYDIWGQLMDSQLNIVRAWTITNLTGVDNAPIACRESPASDGSWRIGVFYSLGGVETVKFSPDGLTFT